ncbi:2-oxo-tetronate isomerase [Dongia sp. agr-C8]
MPRLAANLSMMFPEHEFLDRFAAARKCGFEAVEFLFPYAYSKKEIAARLAGAGLQQVLFNTAQGDWEKGDRGIGAVPGREAEFRAAIEEALDYADTLDCPRLHVMAGLTSAGANLDTFAANLAWAAPIAKQAGVQLMLEPLNPVDFPGYANSSIDTALQTMAKAASDNVFLQYDAYHLQMSQGKLFQTFREHQRIIRHVQIAGVPGRNEPDSTQEINFPALFTLLDELGYAGWVSGEYRPRGKTTDGLGWAKPWLKA